MFGPSLSEKRSMIGRDRVLPPLLFEEKLMRPDRRLWFEI